MPRSKLKSRKRSKPSHYFPEEIIFKILSWTRAKSLLRFKSVCKLWHSIISDNKFIESHHTNSLSNPSIMLITEEDRYDRENRRHYYHWAATIVYSSSSKDSVDLNLPSPFDNMEIVSSCNGIVCVRNFRGDDIYLLNPFTKMSKRLFNPQPSLLFDKHKFYFGAYPPIRKVDVFDCVSHDFKVLKFTYDKDNNFRYNFHPKPIRIMKVHLYSSTANTWKPIKINTNLSKFTRWHPPNPVLKSGPVIDGVLYLEGIRHLLTFDLRNEIFRRVQFPDFMNGRWRYNALAILDFEGHLAMICRLTEEISLWIMEVVSGKVFWNKIHTFDASSKINWVYQYSGAEEFVGKTESKEIILYNCREKKRKHTGLAFDRSLISVLRHTESLIRIDGF